MNTDAPRTAPASVNGGARRPAARLRSGLAGLAVIAVVAAGGTISASAAFAETPASQSMIYFETNSSTATQLYAAPQDSGASALAPVGAVRNFVLYAIAADPTTGKLYGFARTAGTDSQGAPVAIGDLILVSTSDGTSTNLGAVQGLGAGPDAIPAAATFGPDGTMYVTGVGNSILGRVNPATMTATLEPLTEDGGPVTASTGGDITWSNGMLWGVQTGGSSTIVRIDPATGAVSRFAGPAELTAGAVSANATLANGDLLFSVGTAVPSTALVIHVTGPAANAPAFTVVSSTSVAQRFNDGASIAAVPDPTVNPANGRGEMSGTGQPGSTVTITDGAGNVVGTAVVGDDGTWTATITPPLEDGAAVTVTVTGPSGSSSQITSEVTIPTAPTDVTSNGTTVKGTGKPGSKVTVRDRDGNVVGTGTVGDDGTFEVTVDPAAKDGDKLTVTVTDPAGNESDRVDITVDATAPDAAGDVYTDGATVTGSAEPGATVTITDKDGNVVGTARVGEDGTFTATVKPAGKPGDKLTVTVTDPAGNVSKGVTVTVPAAVTAPTWLRVSGDDRYGTAVAIAKQAYPKGAKTVFVATGENFPDALAAGPVAVAKDAPLLLTQSKRLPGVTLAEIKALHPTTIVIVGGTDAVSASVAAQLKAVSGVTTVTRVGGADRFETSRLLADYGFKGGAKTAFVVTGANYPDAVSVSAPAGAQRAPILLVNGSAKAVDAATKAELAKLKVTKTYVAGGTAVISEGVKQSLPNATRLAGADRFGTNLAVAKAFYPKQADRVYVATGANFPDALVGGVLAGKNAGPLLLTSKTAWPKATVPYVKALGFKQGHLLGGPAVLSDTLKKINTTF